MADSRRLVALALLAGSLLGPSPPARASAPAPLKVALILPGPIDDQGWSQSAYEGLALIRQQLGAQVAYQARVPAAEAGAAFRRYAAGGYDFIIGHGGEYLPAGKAAAEAFPRTKFAVVARFSGNNRNLGALSFRSAEVGYLAGVVAAYKTRTKHVAHLSGLPHLMTEEAADGFKRGVLSVDPAIRVSIDWLASWHDTAKAARVAREQVRAGVDFLSVDADLASVGALAEAEKAGIHAISWSGERRQVAPRAIVASVIQRTQVLLLEGAKLVLKKRWEGKQYVYGMREGAQDLALYRGALTPRQAARIDALKRDILRGELGAIYPSSGGR